MMKIFVLSYKYIYIYICAYIRIGIYTYIHIPRFLSSENSQNFKLVPFVMYLFLTIPIGLSIFGTRIHQTSQVDLPGDQQ